MPTIDEGLTTAWVLTGSCFVFFMQIGLTMIEAAQVRAKNRNSMLTKNVLNIMISILVFFLIGYAFAFGGSSLNGILGARSEYAGVFSANQLYHERKFMFYCGCSMITGMLVSGSMAEKTKLEAMLGFSVIIQVLILPLVMCWIWNPAGWVADVGEHFDYGGGIVLFYTGAICALVGTSIQGPRYRRFLTSTQLEIVRGGGRHPRKKTLPGMLEDLKEET
jgi:Amt family ammonium transporter